MSAPRFRSSAIAAVLLCILLVLSSCVSGAADDADGDPGSTTTVAASTTEATAASSSTSEPAEFEVPDPVIEQTTTTTLVPLDPPSYESIDRYHFIRHFTGFTSRGLSRWQRSVPEIENFTITSTADGIEQPVLWLAPEGDKDQPLLVVLHSWSSNYLQHAGIPYALWARENGWAVIAPEFRGRNDDPDAIGSELAVQDVIDAIDFATAQEGVDADRVFAVGYSGGGMMSLLLASRHPDKVTAVAAWGPVYDLVEFYGQARAAGRHYYWEIATACGGDPRTEGPAQDECLQRSPMTYLDAAREAGVPVYIGHGLWDSIVSPTQAANAFNQLADPEDRFTDEQVSTFGRWKVPSDLEWPNDVETYFGSGDPDVMYAAQSANVLLVYFRANHEMVYQAAMRWFASDPR